MRVKTLSITYAPGEFIKTQGHKNHERKHYGKDGRCVTPTGFGWANECRPSRLTVTVAVDDHAEDIWVDRYFKDYWGRLTQGRIEAIENMIPDELVVTEQTSYSGNTYYTVDDGCMASWLSDAKKSR